uniref:AD domain-containing protein n=1 Tax=Arcella intermedia TaxID=1963864 RepID=A0A6B2LMG9_9EUKA
MPESTANQLFQLAEYDEGQARQREKEAISKLEKEAKNIGPGVTVEAQKLFNSIHLIYSNTRWSNKDIIVMNDVIIKAPYKEENCELISKNDKSVSLLKWVKHTIKEKTIKK